jgi:transcriptional regulator with XRE-family HTH domain
MEFNEKLQELRKSKGLTQEELANILYVSRTAVSKWESGRGYPNIDSLKEISQFFSVSIDDLLSGEKLLFIAEKENKLKMQNICDVLFGFVDLFFCILIFLPLYPNEINGYVYSVNLVSYTQTTEVNLMIYWFAFVFLIVLGLVEIIIAKMNVEKGNKILIGISFIINIGAVLLLALTREAYAVSIVFLLLLIKKN